MSNLHGPQLTIYSRGAVHFTNALFYKPSEHDAGQLSFSFAPLLIQEVVIPPENLRRAQGTNPPGGLPKGVCRPGTLLPDPSRLKLDFSRAALYFHSDAIQIKGNAHAQFAYFWCSSDPRQSTRPLVQGLRLTLDSSGRPAIWEILKDPTGLDLIFVAESLEVAARAQFGPPLPGRKYAVESNANRAKKTVVPRVIDDGPVPMGPILYLGRDGGSVATLICRCMPAQATTLVETTTYKLLNADLEPDRTLLTQALRLVRQPAFRVDGEPVPTLENRLRIPDGF